MRGSTTLRRTALLAVATLIVCLAPEAQGRESPHSALRRLPAKVKAAARAKRIRMARCRASPRCRARVLAAKQRQRAQQAASSMQSALHRAERAGDLAGLDEAAARLKNERFDDRSGEDGARTLSTPGQSVAIAPRRAAQLASPDLDLNGRSSHVVTKIGGARAARGNLPREALRKVLEGVEPQVRSCYERATLRGSGVSGRIAAALSVAPSGLVTAVDTSGSTLTDQGMMACVQRAVSRARFPQPENGEPMLVEYYWDLTAG